MGKRADGQDDWQLRLASSSYSPNDHRQNDGELSSGKPYSSSGSEEGLSLMTICVDNQRMGSFYLM